VDNKLFPEDQIASDVDELIKKMKGNVWPEHLEEFKAKLKLSKEGIVLFNLDYQNLMSSQTSAVVEIDPIEELESGTDTQMSVSFRSSNSRVRKTKKKDLQIHSFLSTLRP